MKVTPQIITFIVLVTIGWYSYENHPPFHALVDDIIGYAGMGAEIKQEKSPAKYAKEEAKAVATGVVKPDKQSESQAPSIAVTEVGESSSIDQQPLPVVTEIQPETRPDQVKMPVQEQEIAETREEGQPATDSFEVIGGVKFPPLPETAETKVSQEDKPVDQPDQQQVQDKQLDLSAPPAGKDQLVAPTEVSSETTSNETPNATTSQEEPLTTAEEQTVVPAAKPLQPIDEMQPTEVEQQDKNSGYRIRSPEEIKALEEADKAMAAELPETIEPVENLPVQQPETRQGMSTDTIFKNAPQEQITDVSMYKAEQPLTEQVTSISEFTEADRELEELFNARDIWQQGDHDLAMRTYFEMTMSYPDNPDFPGELGNIYFSKGMTDRAVDAYTESLTRLLRSNDLRRAWNLYSAIKKIAPERAEKLEDKFLQVKN